VARINHILPTLLFFSVSAAASGAASERTPQIGLAGDDLDACLSVGQVTGLNPRGDNYLAVRARPAAGARIKDRLGPGRWIWLCDGEGDWIGIVYGDDTPEGVADCGVGTPVARPQSYAGPCRSGWVHSRYVVMIAG
jgi:hypothetical protein